MKLSNQAIGALLMTLQDCLQNQTDITEMLSDWVLEIKEDEVYITNPPPVTHRFPETLVDIE
tara:strand:- start:3438 stop:3623 length:186 start_codon:yes stop_codon:yes gene_type:complete